MTGWEEGVAWIEELYLRLGQPLQVDVVVSSNLYFTSEFAELKPKEASNILLEGDSYLFVAA